MIFTKEHTYVKLYNGQVVGPFHPFEAARVEARYGEGRRNNFGDREPKIGDVVLTDVQCFKNYPSRNGIKVKVVGFAENRITFGGNFINVENLKNGETFYIMKEDIQWWFD